MFTTFLYLILISLGFALALLLASVILRYDNLCLYILFSLFFSEGIVVLCGLTTIISRSFQAFFILILLYKSISYKIKSATKYQTFGIVPMFSLFMVAVISFIINGKSITAFAVYLWVVYIQYLFFLAVLNLDFSEKNVNTLIKLWILVQLPVVFIKYAIIGQSESGAIGTLSISSGSLSTGFPLFVCSFLLAYYLYERKWKYLFLIIGFLLFGLIGFKKAIPFFLPPVLLIVFFLYCVEHVWKREPVSIAKYVLPASLVVIISFGSFYAGLRLLPPLNPEERIGGSFDIGYALDFAKSDATGTNPNVAYMGRYAAFKETIDVMSTSTIHYLLGFGPGEIVKSRFLPYHGTDVRWDKYGIGYGGGTGLVWFWLQTGLVSVVLYLAFQAILLQQIYRFYRNIHNGEHKTLALGFVGVVVTAVFIFFVYSESMFEYSCLAGPYFYVAAILLKDSYRRCNSGWRKIGRLNAKRVQRNRDFLY